VTATERSGTADEVVAEAEVEVEDESYRNVKLFSIHRRGFVLGAYTHSVLRAVVRDVVLVQVRRREGGDRSGFRFFFFFLKLFF
jgi:hypothetical protein